MVGVDPRYISATLFKEIREGLALRNNYLIAIPDNLVDRIWQYMGKPSPVLNTIFPLDLCYTGVTIQEKLARVRAEMVRKRQAAFAVMSLDEVGQTYYRLEARTPIPVSVFNPVLRVRCPLSPITRPCVCETWMLVQHFK